MHNWSFDPSPLPNFEIEMEMSENISVRFAFNEKKTLLKRFQWWLFTRFFPFRIIKWL
mgnify:CR=1 FL=1